MNSKYFHSLINWKRKSDSLVGLLMDGSWVEDVNCVKSQVKNFFEEKFRIQHGGKRPLLDGVSFSMLSEDDNLALCERIDMDEIRAAVWDCESNKSPGPDDFNFKFIKAFRETLKADIHKVVEDFWANGFWPRGSKAFFIVLIPKVDSPQGLNEFRLIYLVGCLYKIVSKILSCLGLLMRNNQLS